MSRTRILATASVAFAFTMVACADPASTAATRAPADASANRAGLEAGVHRQYGTPTKLGNGMIRTYIVLDEKNDRRPLEVGVAMSEQSLEGLPGAAATTESMKGMKGHDHSPSNTNVFLLDLPAQNPTPYKFVQFDWNPNGHEPDSVYTYPHFDFHFYTVPVEVRNSIVPSVQGYAQMAANKPAQQYWYPFHFDAATLAGGIPDSAATVPLMGMHWLDVRSPELQKLAGNPGGYKQFTKTFIYGSWNGQFIFDEPMITRAYILSKKAATDPQEVDEIIPVSTAQKYSPAGYYPNAYRITWDAQQKEYRIALTQLSWKD